MGAALLPQMPLARSLSGRLLAMTLGFALLSSLLIYVPSVARQHHALLEERLASAQIAVLALLETPAGEMSQALRAELLANAGVRAVALQRGTVDHLFLADDAPGRVDATIDLRGAGLFAQVADSWRCLTGSGERLVRVQGAPRLGAGQYIEAIVDEAPVRADLAAFAARILWVSLLVSFVTAFLVYLALYGIIVRPMIRMTAAMARFRERPQDAARILAPSARADEIGEAERELARLQAELRVSLQRKERLAALGEAVAKINHDLRNMLAPAQLAVERLAAIDDPEVKRLAPRLVGALDRATGLAEATLAYGRDETPAPRRERVALHPLAEELRDLVPAPLVLEVDVPPDLEADADRAQLFRMLSNLVRNAVQALQGRDAGKVAVSAARDGARTWIAVADDGPGVPDAVRPHLFAPFAARGPGGGTGLGLAIVRELARAHGGDAELLRSGPDGTAIRIAIPDRGA